MNCPNCATPLTDNGVCPKCDWSKRCICGQDIMPGDGDVCTDCGRTWIAADQGEPPGVDREAG